MKQGRMLLEALFVLLALFCSIGGARTQELTEGNAAAWGTFASDGAAASVSDDTSHVKVGTRSLRFNTASGFDTGVRYPSAANANWDLRGKDYLVFWAYAVNPNVYGFQGNQPIIVLKSDTGSYRYEPQQFLMTNNDWRLFQIPLSGDSLWVRSVTGTPDLAHIRQIEIHQDTWDYGFTIYYDGMEFITLVVNSLAFQPATLEMYPGWSRTPKLVANTNTGSLTIAPESATWMTSNASVATVNSSGRIQALAPGTANIIATYRGVTATLALTVRTPARAPDTETLDPFVTTPTPGARNEMPVAIIRYLPTLDGVNVDADTAAWSGTVEALKSNIRQFEIETKFMLEEGSRFRGYQNPKARASLGYRAVYVVNVYEPLPPDYAPNHGTGADGVYYPDYNQILTRFNAEHLVRDLGVKEFWIWGYHTDKIAPVESNMSSPTTGDISNSYRFQDDLPVFDRTYTLYNYNFTRTSNEAVHNHGHQLEAILSHVNQLQDGNTDLFWHKFVGQDASGQFMQGRVGDTHHPPNATADYDYWNTNPVSSDIEDWRPDNAGQKKLVSADTWTNIPYAWPYGRVPDDVTQHHWYIYWMQNMPGWGNLIPNGTKYMTDWWMFTADWDKTIQAVTPERGLYADSVIFGLSPNTSVAGSGSTVVTLSGVGFRSGSQVAWNGSQALSPTFVNANTLKVTIPANFLLTPGISSLAVMNPAAGGGTSFGESFTILGTPQMALTSLAATRNGNGSVTIRYTLGNVGTASAAGVVTSSARTLGTGGTSVSNVTGPFTIPAGNSVFGTLTFPAALTVGSHVFQLYGSVGNTGFSLSKTVIVP